jgi:hypothetical protein
VFLSGAQALTPYQVYGSSHASSSGGSSLDHHGGRSMQPMSGAGGGGGGALLPDAPVSGGGSSNSGAPGHQHVRVNMYSLLLTLLEVRGPVDCPGVCGCVDLPAGSSWVVDPWAPAVCMMPPCEAQPPHGVAWGVCCSL